MSCEKCRCDCKSGPGVLGWLFIIMMTPFVLGFGLAITAALLG